MKLLEAFATILLAPAVASASPHGWAPCGGSEDKLWSWAFVEDDASNVVLEEINGRVRIMRITDYSGRGHDYVAAEDRFPDYDPGLEVSGSWGSYKTSKTPILRDKLNSGFNNFGQWMDQEGTLNATGEWYLAFAGFNSRGNGIRDLWGRSTSDWVRLDQDDDRTRISLGGADGLWTTDKGAVPKGPVLIEMWRDENNVIHTWVNGENKSSSNVLKAGTFALSGIGYRGTGSGGWDDYALEYIVCDGLPTAEQRREVREYLRPKWNLYGATVRIARPASPTDLIAQ